VKRAVLLCLALAALVALVPGTANAKTPCRVRIYNDWYPDGKIGTNYPIACYRDALKNMRDDTRTYSSLSDDIRSAMQAAIARLHHRHVPSEVGKGTPPASQPPASASSGPDGTSPGSTDSRSSGPQSVSETLPTTTLAASTTSSTGGGVPVPLLVLGGLALLLVAAGAAGVVAKRSRR